jgi:hypothetical protein
MHPARGVTRQAMVMTLTVLCALFGGILAVVVVTAGTATVDVVPALLLVIGGAVLAVAVALLLLTARPASPPTAPTHDWHQRLPAVAGHNREPVPPPRAAPPQATPGHLVLPLTDAPPSQAREWWNKGAPATAANENNRQAPALASYVASGAAIVAQCPNCGDFRIDVQRGDPAYSFRCRNPRCGEQWRWTPGTAWPSVVVRRNLT